MTLTVVPPLAGTVCNLRSALTTAVHVDGSRTVVVLRGEADFSTSPLLSDVLSRVIASRAGDVVIDLAEASFIDTAAVRALALAHVLLGRRGHSLTVRSPSRLATRLLYLFGLTDLVEAREAAGYDVCMGSAPRCSQESR